MTTETIATTELESLHELAQQLRVDSVRAAAAAGSGHPTSSMSAADLMAVLISRHLRSDVATPGDPNNDRLIFSKGHASPLLYSVFKAIGAVSDDELTSFRRFARVIDAYSIKPIDAETLRAAARETGGPVVTVEDHWPEGGLGDAVISALVELDAPPRVAKLAVRDLPGSGKPAELLAAAGIDADAIAERVRQLAKELGPPT